MKEYRNGMKATEFTGWQIGIIYRAAKAGEINLEKWVAKEFYDLAEYYNFDDNGSVESSERKILTIIDAMINGDIQKAQELIDAYTESNWNLLSRKAQERADRRLVK